MTISHEWVGAIGTWVGALAVIATLWFLWVQMKQIKQSIQSSTSHNIYQTIIDIDRFFSKHPQFRVYFYNGKVYEDGHGIDKNQLLAIAEMITDSLDAASQQQSILSEAIVKSLHTYIKGMYKTSPILREYVSEKVLWYPPIFMEIFKEPDL